MDTILVIDDEPGIRTAIRDVLENPRIRVLSAENGEVGLNLFRNENPSVVLLDLRLGSESGMDLFQRIRAHDPRALVVFITGHGTSDTAIETIKRGAYDYLVKPLDFDQLTQVVDQALRIGRLMRAPATVDTAAAEDETSDRLIGNGPAMQAICKQIGRIAPQDVNVMILGESGTGKELVARAIYHHSRRSMAPFLAINCAAIPETLLESELFGHEKGAFTGADRRRVGKFEQCDKGTVFLDEVGDMPLATQAKILRLLQGGQFQRVGGNETMTVDVRVLAATNQDLESMIESGRFRRDLYYRLRGVTLHLPPLRDRLEDIPELAHYFLYRFNRQLGTAVQSISQEALEKLQSHAWPGNVRELQSAVREALIVSVGPTLLPEFVPIEVRGDVGGDPDGPVEIGPSGRESWTDLGDLVDRLIADDGREIYRKAMQRFDRIIVARAMAATEGNRSHAAELLGLSRPTLRAKLRTAKGAGVEPG